MKIAKIKLSDLKRPERNIRIHSEKQIREFERSVGMFGQIRPIVADENNVILCGNGLYEVLLKMGFETADVYKIKDLSENQKKKLMIADNKIYGLGIDDLETFNDFLSQLGDDLDIPGFDESILRSMTAEAEAVTERISEYGTVDEDEIQAIRTAGERKEAMTANPPFNESESDPVSNENSLQQTEPSELPEQSEQSEPLEETRDFVICPECGCRIWL